MARLAEALAFFAPEIEVLRFPAWDCLPYDRVSPNPEIVSERIATLARLLEPAAKPRLVLTTVNALVQRVPPRPAFEGVSLIAERLAAPWTRDAVIQRSWRRMATAAPAPSWSRASMPPAAASSTCYPAGEPDPVRIDLFGDTVESLRRFDPSTQRSTAKMQALVLRPVSEVPLDPESVSRFREGLARAVRPKGGGGPAVPGDLRWTPLPRHGALGAAVP